MSESTAKDVGVIALDDVALVRQLRRAVAIEATRVVYGYCAGQAEKAEHHVEHILPALCRVIGMAEIDLAVLMHDEIIKEIKDE